MYGYVHAGQHPDMPSWRLSSGKHASGGAPGPPDLLLSPQRQCGAALLLHKSGTLTLSWRYNTALQRLGVAIPHIVSMDEQ